MSATIQLRLLDAFMLATLRAIQIGDGPTLIVGDMETPKTAGWSGSVPNAPGTEFTPYVVLVPLTAAPAPNTGSFAGPQTDWHIPYNLDSYGASREQARGVADYIRDAVAELHHEEIQLEAKYKVQQVWTQSIGGPSRRAATDPPIFGETDQVTLWLAKRR